MVNTMMFRAHWEESNASAARYVVEAGCLWTRSYDPPALPLPDLLLHMEVVSYCATGHGTDSSHTGTATILSDDGMHAINQLTGRANSFMSVASRVGSSSVVIWLDCAYSTVK